MQKNTILVVDDEVSILTLMKQAFSRAGYEVRTADSAKAALEILEDEKIHVMFLDLNMPEMNGLELCRRIRKDMPMAIIIAMTGHASLFELADCREAGFDDYFIKPVSISTLVETAEKSFKKIERWTVS